MQNPQNRPSAEEIIAGKDRMIGELYSKCRALEEAYVRVLGELKALKERK